MHPLSRLHKLDVANIRLQILLDQWCNHLFVFIRVSRPYAFYQSLRRSRHARARATLPNALVPPKSFLMITTPVRYTLCNASSKRRDLAYLEC